MKDLTFDKLRCLPVVLLLIWLGLWMKNAKNDLNQDNYSRISGVIAPEIEYGDYRGKKYISFQIDSCTFRFKISDNSSDAIRASFGMKRFDDLMQVGNSIEMWVDKEDLEKHRQSVSVGYLTIDGSVITQFEDLNLEYEKEVAIGNKNYWVPILFAIGTLLYSLLGYEFPIFRRILIIPHDLKKIDVNSLKNFEIGEYSLRFDEQHQIIEINNQFITKIKIDLKDRKIVHKQFFINVFTCFDDIDSFGLGSEKGEVDIYLRHKKGMSFCLLNTKSGGFKFLDPSRKEKEKIEIIFLSILNSIVLNPSERS